MKRVHKDCNLFKMTDYKIDQFQKKMIIFHKDMEYDLTRNNPL